VPRAPCTRSEVWEVNPLVFGPGRWTEFYSKFLTVTGPTLLCIAAVVSPCRCEPLRAGCCGGEGVLGVS